MKNIIRIFILGLSVVLICALTGCGSKSSIDVVETTVVPTQTEWIGQWKGVDSNHRQEFFVDISEKAVKILWNFEDGRRELYWDGSFQEVVDNHVLSMVNSSAMKKASFGSESKTKLFLLVEGTLVFDATVLGFTKSIHLEK